MSALSEAVVPSPLNQLDEHVLDLPDQLLTARALLEALPAAVYTTDAAGRITSYNNAAVDLWGRRPELGEDEWCGSWRLYWPDGTPMPHDQCPMAVALKEQRAIRGAEAVAERPDGTRIPFLAYPTPLRDETGAVVGAVNTLIDITEHKLADEVGARLAAIVESSDDAIVSKDLDGIVLTWNRGAEHLFGYTAEEIVGQPITILIPPDRHDEEPSILERIRRGERIDHYETVRRRKDGRLVEISLTVSPVRNAKGRIIGASKIARDITEIRQMDAAGARLAAIVESSDDAIVSKDLDGIVLTWNRGAERLFGYAAEEMVGQPITTLIPPDRHDEEAGILERIRRGERIEHYETVRMRKDGSLVDISLSVSPVTNAEGRIIGASKIARDITERRRAEERQDLLLREMNHRVRNLFALASSLVTLSTRSADTPEHLSDAVRARLGALARAQDLTLPDFAGAGERTDKATTLPALLRAIVAPYDQPERQDAERVEVSGPQTWVRGSAVTSLALLLNEFAANAAKYGALSAPTGHVDVRWTVTKHELLLTWRERGGPPVAGPPEDEGFGSLLARGTVEGQLGGRISRDWQPEGLVVHLSVPLSSLTS